MMSCSVRSVFIAGMLFSMNLSSSLPVQSVSLLPNYSNKLLIAKYEKEAKNPEPKDQKPKDPEPTKVTNRCHWWSFCGL